MKPPHPSGRSFLRTNSVRYSWEWSDKMVGLTTPSLALASEIGNLGQLHRTSSSGDQRQKRAVRRHLASGDLAVRALCGPQGLPVRFKNSRRTYNCERPHETIGMNVPVSRYQVSDKTYPEEPPLIEYGPSDEIRKVNPNGQISSRSCRFKVGKAFGEHPVALRQTTTERGRRPTSAIRKSVR